MAKAPKTKKVKSLTHGQKKPFVAGCFIEITPTITSLGGTVVRLQPL